jgi:hypothetical protein
MNAICILSIVPLRSSPSDVSEMVNQLLYGEHLNILATENDWFYVESILDKYKGWADKKQIEITSRLIQPKYIAISPIYFCKKTHQYFPAGSFFQEHDKALFDESENSILKLDTDRIINKADAVNYAKQFLHAPYLWGGRSIFGIDCSGLTQIAYRLTGMDIKRDASQQAEMGTHVKDLQHAENGDLAFFNKGNGDKVTHVGIVMKQEEKTQIIHASGQVKIDTLTSKGIVNETDQLTHHLLFIKDLVASN